MEREEEGGAEPAVLLQQWQPAYDVERKGYEDAGPAVLQPSWRSWRCMRRMGRNLRSPPCCGRRAAEDGARGSREGRGHGARRVASIVLLQLGHEAGRGEDEDVRTAVLLQLRRPAHDAELATGEASFFAGLLPPARTMRITGRTGKRGPHCCCCSYGSQRTMWNARDTKMRGPLCFCRAGAAGAACGARGGGICGVHRAAAAMLLKLGRGDQEKDEDAGPDGLLLSCCCSWGTKRGVEKTRT